MTTTISDAFAEAKTEHSAPAERAEPSGSPDASSSPDPNESPAATSDTAPADTPDSSSDLISDAELSALQQTHADDPAALAKALKGKYTQKTQALAAERKAIADVAAHADTLRAYQANPEAFLRAEAQKLGLQVGAPVAETRAVAQAQTVVDTTIADFKTALGPELEFIADSLAPAIKTMVETVTKQTVEASTAPLKAAQDALVGKAAEEHTAATMQAFEAKHPDWKQHEPAMMKIAGTLQPKGMAEADYLDTLYTLATIDIQKAEAVKAAHARMSQAAKTAETRTDGTAEKRVDTSSKKPASIRDAFLEAKAELTAR